MQERKKALPLHGETFSQLHNQANQRRFFIFRQY